MSEYEVKLQGTISQLELKVANLEHTLTAERGERMRDNAELARLSRLITTGRRGDDWFEGDVIKLGVLVLEQVTRPAAQPGVSDEIISKQETRIENLEAAVEFAKREFYARGRRDLVVEQLGGIGYTDRPERILEAADAGEDFSEHPQLTLEQLGRFYIQTVEEMKNVPRPQPQGAN